MAKTEARRECIRPADQADGLFGQLVGDEGQVRLVLRRAGQQNHVKVQRFQLMQQFRRRAGAQHHFHIRPPQHGAQEGNLEVARQRCHAAHPQHLPGGAGLAQGGDQLFSG